MSTKCLTSMLCAQVAEQAPQIAAQAGQQLIAGSQQVCTPFTERLGPNPALRALWVSLLLFGP